MGTFGQVWSCGEGEIKRKNLFSALLLYNYSDKWLIKDIFYQVKIKKHWGEQIGSTINKYISEKYKANISFNFQE